MKTFKKIGDTSIRVIETLKLLSRQHVSIQDIILYFEQIDPQNRIYTNEVILKYINTLKVFGFKFIKEKDKYVLLNAPPKFDFNELEIQGFYLTEKLADMFPEESVKREIHTLLQELEKKFNDNTKLLAYNIKKPQVINLKFNFNYNKYKDTIKELEKYCSEKQKLKIMYKNNIRVKTSAIVEPNEIKYLGNEVYFNVYNPLSAQIHDIKLSDIEKIEQLPLKSNTVNILSNVTFKLIDRLAKTYILKEGERLLQINPDGSIIIINQKEDRTLLLKRLMRYGENCEIISPKTLLEEMHQLIKSTLSNYS